MTFRRRDVQTLGLATMAASLIAAPAQAQPVESTWASIRANKVLRLGVTPSEPWYAKDPASGAWAGFGVSLAQQIGRDIDVRVDFVETTWANAPAGLQANQFDIMFVLDPTPARSLAIDFPFAPVLYYALGYLAREDLGAHAWSDLDKPEVTIAVPLGTSMDRWVSAHLTHATVTRLATIDDAILHYQSRRSRVLVLFHPALVAYRLKVGEGQVVVPRPAVTSVAGAGLRREADKTWRDFMTSTLTFYYENGTTEQLYRDYLAKRGLDPASVPGITKESFGRA